ncbi:MAG: polysaccharide ABC transporter ATP-binding protein [Desulfurivibrionaceae bacterium]
MSDVLIKAEGVSKKFCKSLKRSMLYGIQDITKTMFAVTPQSDQLRDKEFWAVDDISFELKRGECLGLIGANGSGKSTLLKILNGIIEPDKGRIQINGKVGALIELGAGFHPMLSGRENIYIYGSILGFSKKEIDRKFDAIVAFAEIADFIDTPVKHYSSGMYVRLGFSVAAQMEPDVLIIDEVLAVGDIGFRIKCLNRIHELLDKAAVIFVSHSMPFVARLCNQVMVLRQGEDIFSSSDVPKGIDFYNKEFKTGERVVVGSGEVEILELSINGEDKDTITAIPFGGSLTLGVDLAIHSKCQTLCLRLGVFNADQRPVVDFITEDYQPFIWENDAELATVKVEIPALHLASGKHTVAIVIFDHATTRVICRMDNAVSFIMGHHISTGCDSFYAAHWSKF